jgi:hypothetical protein
MSAVASPNQHVGLAMSAAAVLVAEAGRAAWLPTMVYMQRTGGAIKM